MDFFKKNRKKLIDKLDNNSVAIMFAGEASRKRGDEFYPFSPDRNFYYVTGIDCPKPIVLISKINDKIYETLFIERDNGIMAKWVGRNLTPIEAAEKSDIENIMYIDEFESEFSDFVFKNNIETVYLDLENRDMGLNKTMAFDFAQKLKLNFPHILIKNVYPIFAQLRLIKEEYELVLMQKAMDITTKGIEAMMKIAQPGMYEYEIEAYFDFVLKRHGVKQKAFESIAASGKNGTILHYSSNDSQTKDGDLILFDVGAMVGWYAGDITRTFPVNGKFTDEQKKIYNIVLEGQQKVIDAIRPGITISQLNDILKQHYFEELKKIGLADKLNDVSKYYYHSVGHFIGAETHDIGRNNDTPLKEGMVITVEPGLYIEDMKIGIRIEDDVLVTDSGCVVMTQDMIKTVEEIEAFMNRD